EYDIEADEYDSRSDLVEAVYFAIVESRREHEVLNNDTVRVEERKYDIAGEELDVDDRVGPEYGDTELPVRYNETRMVLLLRDPAWAYAYWDVRDAQMEEFTADPNFEGLSLRLVEMDNPDMGDHTVVDAVDIPVQQGDSRWYINLPQQETNYYVELIAWCEGNRHVLVRSKPVSVPRGGPAFDSQVRQEAYDGSEALVALSGVERLEVSGFERRIPQRIMSLIDQYSSEQ
ncbi:MAG: DUF4912 domain-containing protein, partial [Spirochaetota bacterium]